MDQLLFAVFACFVTLVVPLGAAFAVAMAVARARLRTGGTTKQTAILAIGVYILGLAVALSIVGVFVGFLFGEFGFLGAILVAALLKSIGLSPLSFVALGVIVGSSVLVWKVHAVAKKYH